MGEFFLFELSDLKPIGQTILFKSNRFSKSGVAMHMTNPGWITTYVVFFHLFVYMYLRICLLCFFFNIWSSGFLLFLVYWRFCVSRVFFFLFWASRTVIQLILHAFIYSFVFCLTWSQLVISTDHLVLMTAIASRKIKITIKTRTLATRVPPVGIFFLYLNFEFLFRTILSVCLLYNTVIHTAILKFNFLDTFC